MAAPTLYKAAGNEFSTTLASPATDSDLSLELSSVAGLETGGGILILDEGVVASEEVVAYTSYVGTTVTIPSGGRGLSGTSAHSHAIGATVKDILVSEHVNKLITSFTAEHSEAGVHGAATVTSLKASTAEIETGTSDVKVVTPLGLASSEYGQYHNSMSRQAIINGNFDIWQRGTSASTPDVTTTYLADRWRDYVDKNGGTLPTLTRSRQLQTSGDIQGSYYFTRLATNGAGTSLGVSSQHLYYQTIENGTRNLAGASKTVTVSYWARSSIANKRISVTLFQNYGTGGSPSSQETILGVPVTLTSTWTRYTYTFTTNTLVGKTFGTNNDDYLNVMFAIMWGTTFGNSNVQAGVSAETYVGSGNIDIAQVQLCSGDVALPFQPKSYGQELEDCQRYTCVYGANEDNTTDAYKAVRAMLIAQTATAAAGVIHYPVQMRAEPTITVTGSEWRVSDQTTATACTSVSLDTTQGGANCGTLVIATASGLTAYRPYTIQQNNNASARMIFSAEL